MLKESDSGFIYKSIKGVLVKKFYNFRKILESFAYVANERLHCKTIRMSITQPNNSFCCLLIWSYFMSKHRLNDTMQRDQVLENNAQILKTVRWIL